MLQNAKNPSRAAGNAHGRYAHTARAIDVIVDHGPVLRAGEGAQLRELIFRT
jgi:hypothetical protein